MLVSWLRQQAKDQAFTFSGGSYNFADNHVYYVNCNGNELVFAIVESVIITQKNIRRHISFKDKIILVFKCILAIVKGLNPFALLHYTWSDYWNEVTRTSIERCFDISDPHSFDKIFKFATTEDLK